MTATIYPIVEGQGEEQAIPELLRKILHSRGIYNINIGSPIRQTRGRIIRELEKYLITARRQRNCKAIIIIFDADDDCPVELAQ